MLTVEPETGILPAVVATTAEQTGSHVRPAAIASIAV
jgi:hypothetical protein